MERDDRDEEEGGGGGVGDGDASAPGDGRSDERRQMLQPLMVNGDDDDRDDDDQDDRRRRQPRPPVRYARPRLPTDNVPPRGEGRPSRAVNGFDVFFGLSLFISGLIIPLAALFLLFAIVKICKKVAQQVQTCWARWDRPRISSNNDDGILT